MSTIENLLVHILESKHHIVDLCKKQLELYDRHLISPLLVDGIQPPPLLLESVFDYKTQSFQDLRNEESVSELLLRCPQPTASYSHPHCNVSDNPSVLAETDGFSDHFSVNKYCTKNDFEPRNRSTPVNHVDSADCICKSVPMQEVSARSPQYRAGSSTVENHIVSVQPSARIQRSKSRQKDMELRNSANQETKSCLTGVKNTSIDLSGILEPITDSQQCNSNCRLLCAKLNGHQSKEQCHRSEMSQLVLNSSSSCVLEQSSGKLLHNTVDELIGTCDVFNENLEMRKVNTENCLSCAMVTNICSSNLISSSNLEPDCPLEPLDGDGFFTNVIKGGVVLVQDSQQQNHITLDVTPECHKADVVEIYDSLTNGKGKACYSEIIRSKSSCEQLRSAKPYSDEIIDQGVEETGMEISQNSENFSLDYGRITRASSSQNMSNRSLCLDCIFDLDNKREEQPNKWTNMNESSNRKVVAETKNTEGILSPVCTPGMLNLQHLLGQSSEKSLHNPVVELISASNVLNESFGLSEVNTEDCLGREMDTNMNESSDRKVVTETNDTEGILNTVCTPGILNLQRLLGNSGKSLHNPVVELISASDVLNESFEIREVNTEDCLSREMDTNICSSNLMSTSNLEAACLLESPDGDGVFTNLNEGGVVLKQDLRQKNNVTLDDTPKYQKVGDVDIHDSLKNGKGEACCSEIIRSKSSCEQFRSLKQHSDEVIGQEVEETEIEILPNSRIVSPVCGGITRASSAQHMNRSLCLDCISDIDNKPGIGISLDRSSSIIKKSDLCFVDVEEQPNKWNNMDEPSDKKVVAETNNTEGILNSFCTPAIKGGRVSKSSFVGPKNSAVAIPVNGSVELDIQNICASGVNFACCPPNKNNVQNIGSIAETYAKKVISSFSGCSFNSGKDVVFSEPGELQNLMNSIQSRRFCTDFCSLWPQYKQRMIQDHLSIPTSSSQRLCKGENIHHCAGNFYLNTASGNFMNGKNPNLNADEMSDLERYKVVTSNRREFFESSLELQEKNVGFGMDEARSKHIPISFEGLGTESPSSLLIQSLKNSQLSMPDHMAVERKSTSSETSIQETKSHYESFFHPTENEQSCIVGEEISFENLDIANNAFKTATVMEHLRKSIGMHTPLYGTRGTCESVSNGSWNNSGVQLKPTYTDSSPFPCRQFASDISMPSSPSVDMSKFKFNKSWSSERQRNSNPELECFPIEEEENENMDATHDENCLINKETENSVNPNPKPLDEIEEECSDCTASRIRESVDSYNTEISFIGSHNMVNPNTREPRNARISKENQCSVNSNNVKNARKFVHGRDSKQKISSKSRLGVHAKQSFKRDSKHSNIVTNITSFIPFVQQKQASLIGAGKRDVKVKALEAAEASKRLEEEKENKRRLKKESVKLKLEQERDRKKKMEEQKRVEADVATKKRMREKEEKMENERKRKCIEQGRRQHVEKERKQHTDKFSRPFHVEKHMQIERQKLENGKGDGPLRKKVFSTKGQSVVENPNSQSYCIERIKVTSKSDKFATNISKGQGYEMSPYLGSDDEDEENYCHFRRKKTIPTWTSEHSLALFPYMKGMEDFESVLLNHDINFITESSDSVCFGKKKSGITSVR